MPSVAFPKPVINIIPKFMYITGKLFLNLCIFWESSVLIYVYLGKVLCKFMYILKMFCANLCITWEISALIYIYFGKVLCKCMYILGKFCANLCIFWESSVQIYIYFGKVLCKFMYILGKFSANSRLFFSTKYSSLLISPPHPPLHGELFAGRVKLFDEASALSTHVVFQLVIFRKTSLSECVLQGGQEHESLRVLNGGSGGGLS
jgi:hypothetical protein